MESESIERTAIKRKRETFSFLPVLISIAILSVHQNHFSPIVFFLKVFRAKVLIYHFPCALLCSVPRIADLITRQRWLPITNQEAPLYEWSSLVSFLCPRRCVEWFPMDDWNPCVTVATRDKSRCCQCTTVRSVVGFYQRTRQRKKTHDDESVCRRDKISGSGIICRQEKVSGSGSICRQDRWHYYMQFSLQRKNHWFFFPLHTN